MKHNLKITAILLVMFVLTQFIGLYVVNYYSPVQIVDGQVVEKVDVVGLPFGLETPKVEEQGEYVGVFVSIIIAFAFAIGVMFLLIKFNTEVLLKLWFFVVVIIALGISFTSFLSTIQYASLIALILAIPLAYFKIYKQQFLVHNTTELLVYPGIAAVFVPILNVWTVIGLLVLISVYDMWAVWHSGIMQKMAKYQMDKLKVFSGFFLPYADKKTRAKIKSARIALKAGKITEKDIVKKKFKVNVAILGGGDVIFPIITAGVMLKTLGFLSSVLVIVGATLGLSYLFFFAEKKKFYPAMPYISAGIFLGIALSYLLL